MALIRNLMQIIQEDAAAAPWDIVMAEQSFCWLHFGNACTDGSFGIVDRALEHRKYEYQGA
jgi:hypothetical protein